MNTKSLLTAFALVATTASAAFAKPATFTVQADASFTVGAPMVRDHRDGRNEAPPVRTYRDDRRRHWFQPRLVQPPVVANNTQLINSNGYSWSEYTGPVYTPGTSWRFAALTEATRIGQVKQDFWVNGTQANTIQLRGLAGSTMVTQVAIEFGAGSKTQVVQVNRDLRDGSITIELEGTTRAVSRIAVYGTSGQRSSYQIFAR